MKTCDECGDVYYAKDKCVKHYFKARRKTTRERIPEGAVCVVDHCNKPMRCKRMCRYHYDRERGYRKPTPNAGTGRGMPGRPKKESTGYRGAHLRVEQARGKACDHVCIRCGVVAQEWALDPAAVHTYEDTKGRVWSMDIDDYHTMCISHHRLMDLQSDDWYIGLWLESKV